jgi:molybdate transport system substrate-binding protein
MSPREAAPPRARRSRLAVAVVSLVVAGLIGCARLATASPPRTLTVFAAASLAEPFTELGHMLDAEQPGLKTRFSFAGSQQLAAQIDQGSAADLFASADDRWMSYLAGRGRLAGDARTFAQNRLVVIVPRSNPARIGRLEDLSRRGVKLVLGAAAVPVGAYSREALQRLSRQPGFPPDYGARVLANLVSEEENVKSVLAKVELAEADAGMVYRSDVCGQAARHVRVFELPDSANVIARYPIAVVRGAPDEPDARAFLALLGSPAGYAILERCHLMPVTGAP